MIAKSTMLIDSQLARQMLFKLVFLFVLANYDCYCITTISSSHYANFSTPTSANTNFNMTNVTIDSNSTKYKELVFVYRNPEADPAEMSTYPQYAMALIVMVVAVVGFGVVYFMCPGSRTTNTTNQPVDGNKGGPRNERQFITPADLDKASKKHKSNKPMAVPVQNVAKLTAPVVVKKSCKRNASHPKSGSKAKKNSRAKSANSSVNYKTVASKASTPVDSIKTNQ